MMGREMTAGGEERRGRGRVGGRGCWGRKRRRGWGWEGWRWRGWVDGEERRGGRGGDEERRMKKRALVGGSAAELRRGCSCGRGTSARALCPLLLSMSARARRFISSTLVSSPSTDPTPSSSAAPGVALSTPRAGLATCFPPQTWSAGTHLSANSANSLRASESRDCRGKQSIGSSPALLLCLWLAFVHSTAESLHYELWMLRPGRFQIRLQDRPLPRSMARGIPDWLTTSDLLQGFTRNKHKHLH
ncbi:hypothetical protein VTN02DRAFT_3525 [Thermoascus thermophilus]